MAFIKIGDNQQISKVIDPDLIKNENGDELFDNNSIDLRIKKIKESIATKISSIFNNASEIDKKS